MPEIRMPVGGTTPPTPSINEVSLYVKGDKRFYMQDDSGAEVKLLTDEATLAGLNAQLPLTSSGGSTPTLAVNTVSTTSNGVMTFQDKVKLNNATALNTVNTIVSRDALGNFTANEITANLKGQATTVATAPALIGEVTSNGTTNATVISNGVINNDKISATANIALTKLAVDPRDRSTHTGLQLASTISDFGTSVNDHLSNNSPVVDAMISSGANISLSKLASDPLDRSNHTGTQTSASISDFTTQVDIDVANYIASNPFTNNEIDASANIELSKLETNPLDRSNHTGTQLASTISDFNASVPLALTEGNGVDITLGTISVIGTSNKIDVTGGTIDISSGYVGQTSITTLGNITTGTWGSTTIGIGVGGTGATSPGSASNNLIALRTITSSDTLDDDDTYVIADASTSVITIALPSASEIYKFVIKKIDASNNVVINADAGDLIEGNASTTLTTQYQDITLVSDGVTSWYTTS